MENKLLGKTKVQECKHLGGEKQADAETSRNK